ncbi:hypothetical protein BGX27_007990 [Mortierella sp. AM989]|nr:hypothetical protein BGX27_007990 [Mortierella sp. AM989]
MGTFNGVAVHRGPSSSGPSSLPHSSHRTLLKPPSQVRWPVNLNQLAAISLEDDSDLDRSFTDASKDNIGSVKLLRFLKDSDDELTAVTPPSRLRRPKSTYGSLQTSQQLQNAGASVARASSLRGFNGSQSNAGNTGIPKPPQRTRSDIKGPNNSTTAAIARPVGLRHYRSESLLSAPKRQVASENPEDMERIFSEANAIAQRLGNASSGANNLNNTGQGRNISGIRGPGGKGGPSSNPGNMIRRPAGTQSISSPSPSGTQLQARSKISAPSKTLSSSNLTANLKQRMPLQGTVGPRQDTRLTASPRNNDTASPARILGPPGSIQSTTAARKLPGLQQSPLSRPGAPKYVNTDGQIAMTLLPSPTSSGTIIDSESSRTIFELREEIERWKIEASEHRQEKLAAETWRKQILDLERDLEVALDSLSSAEAKVTEVKSERESVDSRIADYEKIIESLKADLGTARTQKDRTLEEAAAIQKEQMEKLEACNREYEKKLAQAQNEIDQLELQVVPAELQDVHQSLFSATQQLEEAKQRNEKLNAELSEEKAKVAREQEDSGQLLVKLSQLQDTIANHLRDNNALKDIVKEHEKCQENAEAVGYQHKKELERMQNDLLAHQQSLVQEKDQKARFEQAFQEQQYQVHQLQQQVQLQQTQLLQQQTEIVNLRATLEVEQNQSSLLQQRLQEEQRLRNPQFGRRVSLDGELNGSFLMIETTNSGVNPGAAPMNMTSSGPDSMTSTLGGTGVQPLSTAGPNSMSPLTANSMMSPSIQSVRSFDPASPSVLTNQFGMNAAQAAAAALPPTAGPIIPNAISSGGMVGPAGAMGMGDAEPKPTMDHRRSSSSISGILPTGNANNRLSHHSDTLATNGNGGNPNANQTVEELTAQLQHLMKEKDRLQADLSKIPISGGGPMTRRKAEMLEEQMDETEQAIGKVRYSIRMRS